MRQPITVYYEQEPSYQILIQPDFNGLTEALRSIQLENRRFMIVSDQTVSSFYLEECRKHIQPIAKEVYKYVFPSGEKNKNLDTVNACYEHLIHHAFDRNDCLIALGGGVVGDLTGFVAATYLRGVRFIQIPTTLLSMVDSSIGGKTGVDFKAYKNMVGAFHQPKLVYMNLGTLQSLPDAEFYSGMGEIIKHGLIKDTSYYQWLKLHVNEVKSKEYHTLEEMIERSCFIKKNVVEEDPKELGDRALLNFGHTLGHSIEKLKNFTLLHGECVSIGMAAASYLSMQRGYITSDEYRDILRTIQNYRQPISTDQLDIEEVLQVSKLDKKMDLGQIKFILLVKIGKAVIDNSVTEDELRQAVKSVLQ
ncbi:MAG: hypothetical protein K0S47_1690 [Herbinix sp.]|jgi:3-dehydroquinate synthase|nr:hypothetical protein [Herbinix sp.]